MTSWNVDCIASAFVTAATDPAQWGAALEVVARETGSRGAIILPIKGRTPFVPTTESLLPSNEVYFRDGWHTRDVRYRVEPRFMRDGVGVDFDCISDEEIRKEPYYQEFLAPLGLKWGACVRVQAGDDIWSMTLQRGPVEGPFSVDEQVRLAEIGKRLSTAATLARAIGFAHAQGMVDGLEHVGIGAILLDLEGRVLRMNARAEHLLGPHLVVSRSRLTPVHPSLRQAVERMIGAALGLCGVVSLPLPVAVPKATGRGLVLNALPLSGDASLLLAPARAMVLVRDLDEGGLPLQSHLQSVFGLTKAEARLAIEVAAGDGLTEVAERLDVSRNTAQTQLKAVFAKTGTARQAELVRVLSRLASRA